MKNKIGITWMFTGIGTMQMGEWSDSNTLFILGIFILLGGIFTFNAFDK